ncbi:TetR/AcrR family transcriptional regulator [Lactococcus nasutitermitis]|uniref:TetR/AcrR family transcriptional regulator n=1 Tax=Lactococcus nasutitermitis TaxID=1652957 RepID=A0ABV9JCG8_9LACT|nr:TetR family transcriptional regulator [Lactococcus nasutitermitis]
MQTREKILVTARQLIEEKGALNVTVSEIAAKIGLTHAAIYKHFADKQTLLENIALSWLDNILSDIFPFKTKKENPADIVHDWLFTLTTAKNHAYFESPEMFSLYTTFISQNPVLESQHSEHLLDSLTKASHINDKEQLKAILQVFISFHHPAFAPYWKKQFQPDFEAIWTLIAPSFTTKK